jgi:PAS domain S-box-containing protein
MSTHVRVLLVDTGVVHWERLARRLAADGLTVDVATAAGVDECLERLRAESFDCVVSRYQLDGETGLDLLRRVRANRGTIPFVLVTSEHRPLAASEAVAAGVTGYVPTGAVENAWDALAARVRAAVDERGTADQADSRPPGEHRDGPTLDPPAADARTALLEASPDMAFLHDDEGRILDANRQFSRETGVAPEQFAGATVGDVEQTRERGDTWDAIAPGEGHVSRGRFQRTDGGTFPVEIHRRRVPGGSADRILAVARDVTTRERRVAALETLQEAMHGFIEGTDASAVADHALAVAETLFTDSLNAVWLADEAGETLRPVAASNALLETLDGVPIFTRGESTVWRGFEADSVTVYDAYDAQSNSFDPTGALGSAMLLPLGEYGVMLVSRPANAAFDDLDAAVGAILTNTTEASLTRADRELRLRRHRRDLERKNDHIDDMASIISHDLRNLLQVLIVSFEEGRKTGEADHFERGQRTIDRMDELLSDMLTLAQQGNDVESRDPVVVGDLARECWRTVETRDATLVVDLDDELAMLASESRLKQLFENLFNNAVEHGGSDVTVTVDAVADRSGFFVADDGAGIPPEDRATVFESGVSSSPTGTGLGLRIVDEIARSHDWTVRVTDSDAGGAKFEIDGIEWVDRC